MSDTSADDRDARTATLLPYSDAWGPRQNDGPTLGGLMALWPTIGAQALGALAQGPIPGPFTARTATSPDEPATANELAGSAANHSSTGNDSAPGIASPGDVSPAALPVETTASGMIGGTLNSGGGAAPAVTGSAAVPPANAAAISVAVPDAFTFGGSALTYTFTSSAGAGGPLSVTQLNGLVGGFDQLLSLLEQTLQSEVFTQDLPLLGTELGDAFAAGVGALLSFQSVKDFVATALANLQSQASVTVKMVQDAINGALQQAGFGQLAQVSLNNGTGELDLNLVTSDSQQLFSADLAKGFGFPNLPLTGTGTVSASINYALNIQASVSTSGAWSVSDAGGPALSVALDVNAPNATIDADLGFLDVKASNPRNDTNMQGTFSLDTQGNATFTGQANLDLHLNAATQNEILPTVSADLVGGWQFGASAVGTDITAFGSTPSIAINNITFDLGSFVDNFLRPMLDKIEPFIKPLADAFAVINHDLTSLVEVLLPGDSWKALDVAGAVDSSGDDIGDGKITLLDFLKLGAIGPDFPLGISLAPLVDFMSLINQLVGFTSVLDALGLSVPTTPFNLGSYSINQDIRSTSFNLGQAVPNQTKAPDDLTAAIGSLGGVSSNGTSAANVLTTLLTTPDYSVPILNDGTKAFQFLFGGTGDIFDANLPLPSFSFGSINADGVPIDPPKIFGPIQTGIPFIDLVINGALQASFGLNIGYDTTGLQQFAASGFTDSSLISHGLFLADPVVNGVTEPLFSLGGAVQLLVQADAVVASIGGGGDISGQLGLSFTNPGPNYVYQLQSEVANGGLFAPFTATGRVTAGLDAVAKILGQSVASWSSPRVTLYNFTTAGGGKLPTATKWVGETGGDFETAGNWTPAFALTTNSTLGSVDYYGDATIGANNTVSFVGPLDAELTSLTLAATSELDIGAASVVIDGTSTDTVNAGQIEIDGAGNLTLTGGVNNTGFLDLGMASQSFANESPVVTILGLVNLYGKGAIELSSDPGNNNTINSSGANALLWNQDNNILGPGTISAPLLNAGDIYNNSDGGWLWLTGSSITNQGTLLGTTNSAVIGGALDSGLRITTNVDNTGGVIAATQAGAVLIDNGVTITRGVVSTSTGDGAEITFNGQATFDGSTTGIEADGDIHVGPGSMLTLTGLVTSIPFSSYADSNGGIVSAGGSVVLQNVTLHNGLFNALPPLVGGAGGISVSGTATFDGAKGNNVLGVDGFIQVASGNTLVIDGTVSANQPAGGIELAGGELVVGNATADGATLGTNMTGGGDTLNMDDGAIVTGADASSILTNDWTIQGSGQLGNGQLLIANTVAGTIAATGASPLVVNSGFLLGNSGWIGAKGGVLDLIGPVLNTTGTIGATSGTTELDGAIVGGGVLGASGGGLIQVIGSATLDGTAGAVTLTAGTQLSVDTGDIVTLAGTIDNDGSIGVTGPSAALLGNSDTVTIGGGGTITMADGTIDGRAFAGDTFDNVSNLIQGSGFIGQVGSPSSLNFINTNGTVVATDSAEPLTISATIVNKGLLAGANGGHLILSGSVNNTVNFAGTGGGEIEGEDGGTAQLSHVVVTGGVLQTAGSGEIEVSGDSTLDGTNHSAVPGLSGVTNEGNAVVDAGVALTIEGSLINQGSLTLLGDGAADAAATVVVSGKVTLTGNGHVILTDGSNADNSETQIITGTSASDTLDNVNNTIGGAGELGSGKLTLTNEAAGIVNAQGGTLVVNTGTNTVTNHGLLEAASGGTLMLRSNVSNTTGTIDAAGGAVDLDSITVTGGQFSSLPGGAVHVVSNSTLDGSATPVTLTAGSQSVVDPGVALTLLGTIVDQGTLTVTGDSTEAGNGSVVLSGRVALTGTGTVALQEVQNLAVPNFQLPELMTGGTLDNVSALIIGTGGIQLQALTNEAAGVIEANGTFGSLDIGVFDTDPISGRTVAGTIVNNGLLEGSDGSLALETPVANNSTILAQNEGGVGIEANVANSGVIRAGTGSGISIATGATVTNTGTVEADTGNASIFLQGVITGAQSKTKVLGGGRIEFSGGTMSGGSLNNAAFGLIQFDSGSKAGVLSNIAVSNAGTMALFGRNSNPSVTPVATLDIDGTVTVSGGGLVLLEDISGTADSTSQLITGTTASATLDNVDNTIRGIGRLGAGELTLINETKGTIEAIGGTLTVDTGAVPAANKGLMEGLGGVLTLRSVVDGTKGGTISALNNNGTASGIILLDGGTIKGGTVTTDLKDAASAVELTSDFGTLDGTAGAVTLAAGAQVLVAGGQTLTATGAVANAGTISLSGDGFNAASAVLRVNGTATLSGGGLVSLFDGSGQGNVSTQVITGAASSAILDNAANTIRGYGQIGAGLMTLINGAAGTIEATDGAMTVDTGANTIGNQGLLEAVGGTLTLRGVVDGTAGGTVSALNLGEGAAGGGVPGVVSLDGATLRGGTVVTDLKDAASAVELTANGATLDGTAGAVTTAAGARVLVNALQTLTVKGSIANHGTIGVAGNPFVGDNSVANAILEVSGIVTLSGGGQISLLDGTGLDFATTQIITGAAPSATLDNVDNLISGYGSVGGGTLTLSNETKGTIEAIGGTLTVDTGANTIGNQGLLEAVGGTLILRGVVDGTKGGTIAALNDGDGGSGIVLLDGATVSGGTIRTDLNDAGSALELTGKGGTLDGTAGAVTIAAGARVLLAGGQTLTAKGAIVNHGILGDFGNPFVTDPATVRVAGTVTLTGGGLVSLLDSTGLDHVESQLITGTTASDALDNVDNLISGYGQLGGGTLTLTNESKGTIEALVTTLTVDTGTTGITNKGLMEGVGGTLVLKSDVANSGTISAGAGGGVTVLSTITNSGLAATASGGTMTVQGTISGALSTVTVAGGGLLVLDGGELSGGTLGNAAGGNVQVTQNSGTLAGVAVTNAGTLSVIGNPFSAKTSALHLTGTVTLSGGGTMSLFDGTGLDHTETQLITGAAASDTLDNVDNLISGYGSLGGGTLTLTNESKGTIEALVTTLTVDTGTTGITNKGLMEGVGGTLVLNSDVANSGTIFAGAGGGVAILSTITNSGLATAANGGTMTVQGTIIGAQSTVTVAGGGLLVLDGGELSGGTLGNAADGNVQVTQNSGTLAGATVTNAGTISVIGNPFSAKTSTLHLTGTVTLSGGGTMSLFDGTGLDHTETQLISGAAASDTLDNVDNLISGYGSLGGGTLTLTNETKGTIEALVSTLTVDTGAISLINHGLLEAVGGTLVLQSVVDGTQGGSISALRSTGSVSGIVLLDGGTVRGGTIRTDLTDPASEVELTINGGTLDGTAGAVTIAAGAQILVGGQETLTATGAIADGGTISVTGNAFNINPATLRLHGTATLSGGGLISMSDASGLDFATTQLITGTTASDALDNQQGLVSGYGALGGGTLTLINETKGTIEATVSTLTVDTGATGMTNQGLLEAVGGTLMLETGVSNTGTLLAGAGGTVIVDGSITNAALGTVASGGTMTIHGTIDNTTGSVTVAGGALLILDGGEISGGTLSNAAAGHIQVVTNGGTLVSMAVANAGTLSVMGNAFVAAPSVLHISGKDTLTGGGTVLLLDVTGLVSAAAEEITGAVSSDTLDNVDNVISGYGALGGGTLTLINEIKGTIAAAGGTLTVDTGATPVINHGVIEADGGTLVLTGEVDSTPGSKTGGTLSAVNSGIATGVVILDGATLRGGTVMTDLKDPASVVELTANGGTLDGTAGVVTIATGAQLQVATQILTMTGAVANQGVITLAGNPFDPAEPATLRISGTVTLSGGGTISLLDSVGFGTTATQTITGTTASDTLENEQNLISGYGVIGGGTLTLMNETNGTIEASTGTLIVDTATTPVTNQGLLEAASTGMLDLRSNVLGAGGTIETANGLVELDGITVSGGELATSGIGTIEAIGTAVIDGSAAPVTLAAGASLATDGIGEMLLEGTVNDDGALFIDGTFANAGTLTGEAVVAGSGTFDNLAGATVTAAITAAGAGDTISNLGVIDGLISLSGGDRIVTGVGAQFNGGIDGGTGGNTLEIVSGPYTLKDFNAPGSAQYSTLQIDAGVSVSLDVSDVLSGVTLLNLGSLNLSAFEATSPVQNSGEIVGDVTLASGVPLVNTADGTISGSGLAVIEGMNGPASVLNAGDIDPAQYGVDFPAGGTVTNLAGGVIQGTVAGVLISGGPGTVTNGGTIIGGGIDAVSLAAGFANRVILAPGDAFTGIVDGGNPVGGTIASVLELAGDAGVTPLSGLGTQFINFSTVSIDAGAFVALSGQNTLASGVALTDAGLFTITGGSSLTEASAGLVTGTPGSTEAVMAVEGVGSSWTAVGGAVAGAATAGRVTVSGGGSLSAAASGALPAVALGVSTGGSGSLSVAGAGSSATLTGQLNVGEAGSGALTISGQGTVQTGNDAALDPAEGLDIAQGTGGSGEVTVSGTKSLLSNSGRFVVGDKGMGGLAIQSGGSVVTTPGTVAGLAGLVIANTASASGSSVNVSGTGSSLGITGRLDVGLAGSGGLQLSGGGTVSAGSLDAGVSSAAVGQIGLSGTGTSLNITGNATIADSGTGVLSILAGATVNAASLSVGAQSGSSGALVISGNGSDLNLTGALNIGSALGIGDLTLGPGAAVHASVINQQGQEVLEGGLLDPSVNLIRQGSTTGGSGTIAANDVVDEGVIQAGGSTPSQLLLLVQGTVFGGGTLTVNGVVQKSEKAAPLQINDGGTLELQGAVLNAASVTVMDDLTPTGTYTVTHSVVDVSFSDATGVLLLDDIAGFAGTIAVSEPGDQIVITGGTLSGLAVSNSKTLTVQDSGAGAQAGGIDRIIFSTGLDLGGFSIVNGNTIVACFVAGTRIGTEGGSVAVEALVVGARVSLAAGGSDAVVWVGHRRVDCARHPKPETVWPVCVSAGAFGGGVPVRDLWLSPDHAVFVDGVLVPVKLLVNGGTIRQVVVPEVTYYHVELPEHAVILAEGMAVESYLDAGDRGDFADQDVVRLFPDFEARLAGDAATMWETRGAAPLVMAGERLEAVRRMVGDSAISFCKWTEYRYAHN